MNKSAHKDNTFLAHLNQWLLETEEVEGLNRRKRQYSVAASVIYDVQSTLLRVLEPVENPY